ncbi:helix-turn-helix domain-containing protein [Spongiactinospora sp. 9N601]|uniref:helix-turn-helix domain-containing protein n=1 Tax=Spongiactinospora sp. 9N601 TaxID=3375149 RepID=UPI0037A3DAC1
MPSQGSIGDRVRGLRLSRRMSQAQLAGPDLSDSYVSLIESGKRTPTPVVARLLAERLGCTTEFLLHGIEPRQRIDTELGLRHAELELQHGDPAVAADRFGEIIKAAGEENAMLAAHARFGRARALKSQGKLGPAVEAFERLRREAAAHPERLADLPLTIALSRCYQRAGDTLRARDLAGHALRQVSRLGVTHGEIAVDLASVLVEAGAVHGQQNGTLSYVRQVLADNDIPRAIDREQEVRALWRASVTAAQGDDSALAVRLADDAISTGRPARMALRLAKIAMEWSRLVIGPVGESRPGEAREHATAAMRIFTAFPAHVDERATSMVVLAHVHLASGEYGEAARLAGSALELLDGSTTPTAATAHLVLAEIAMASGQGGDPAASLSNARNLLESAPAGEVDRRHARAWRELGDLYGRAGFEDDQAGAYHRALQAVGVRSALTGLAIDSVLTV